MNDVGIIDLYWQRSERAILETETAYGAYCRTVAYNLLRNSEDAEESVNDTWLAPSACRGGTTRRRRWKTASFSGALMRSSHCFPNGSGSFSSDGTSTR